MGLENPASNAVVVSGELRLAGDFVSEKGNVMAKVSAVIKITAVNPNAPPQYTGPTTIADAVVGQGLALQGFDPDNDQITWSVDPANAEQVSVSPAGVLTPLVPLNGEAITVWLDDGKA